MNDDQIIYRVTVLVHLKDICSQTQNFCECNNGDVIKECMHEERQFN